MASPKFVFLPGGTGFMGRRLIETLLQRGHRARALARTGSEKKVPQRRETVPGGALPTESLAPLVKPANTFAQLVGTAHPNPAKGAQFRSVDCVAGCLGADAAAQAGIKHFFYPSLAHPAPMMKSHIQVRSTVEEHIRKSGVEATILRPWYVPGPGRRWPLSLRPVYGLMELLPATRETAKRLGLVSDDQTYAALLQAVQQPAIGVRICNVPDARKASL